MSRPTAITLFSGGGGTAIGLQAAGYDVVGAVEYSPEVAAVYDANFTGHTCTVGRVEDVWPSPWVGVDLIQASPVCTRFSRANANRGESEIDLAAADGSCRFIKEVRPKVFLLENVPDYFWSESYRRICVCLTALGYRFDYTAKVLDAADFGVPQNRLRLILTAVRDGSVPTLRPTHAARKRTEAHGGLFEDFAALPLWNGWYEAVEDLLPGCPDSELAEWQMKRLPAELTDSLLIRGDSGSKDFGADPRPVHMPSMSVVTSHPARAFLVGDQSASAGQGVHVRHMDAPAPTIMTRQNGGYQPKAFLVGVQGEGGELHRDSMKPCQTITTAHSAEKYRALLIDGCNARPGSSGQPTVGLSADPAMTVCNIKGVHRSLENGHCKSMTLRCLARFQSFPDSYILPTKPNGTENKKLGGLVIGNAWPPLMAQRVGEAMRDVL